MTPFLRQPGPTSLPDALVQDGLAQIDGSEEFRRSPQLKRLLRHLIDAVQAGRPDELRELVLGVVVFRRDPARFDPKQDPIVRVEARRLRSRLAAYYAGPGRASPLHIELPKGGYVPVLRRRTTGPKPARSLVVLPFVNLTGDPDREAFCDGLTDELIDALVQLPHVKVVARTSAFHYKGRNIDIRTIGRELGVDLMMEGSVQATLNRRKVIAQLIDTRDGLHVWSQIFETDEADPFVVQNVIAQDVVRSLQLAGTMRGGEDPVPERSEAIAMTTTSDREARELFDRARFIVRSLDLERYSHARSLLHQALERDPRFARAHLLLGLLETNLASYFASNAGDAVAVAAGHIERAVALDPGLGNGHAMLGWIAMSHGRDWQQAEAHYRRALRASPGDVNVHNGWANFLAYTGRFAEADVEYRLARELDPLHVAPRLNRALMLFYACAYDEALADYRQVQEIDPRQFGVNIMACIHVMLHQPQRALDVANETIARFPESPVGFCRKAEALAAAGCNVEARSTLERIVPQLRTAGVEYFARAHLDAVIGDFDSAIEHLYRAGRNNETNFCTAAVMPYFLPLHDDPRWPRFVDECRLPRIAQGARTHGAHSRRALT
ncbi:MAG: tetratricopeptide repeat protein [Betaproteobacteria bacterium]